MEDWLDEFDSPTDYLVWDYPGYESRRAPHRKRKAVPVSANPKSCGLQPGK
jgi:hypothetical protein